MKFLLQRVNNQLVDDFTFEMTIAKEYYDWQGKESLEIEYGANDGGIPYLENASEYIPIGSVEFVSWFLKSYHSQATAALLPLNVPECLFSFANRKILNVTEWKGGDTLNGKRLFCKSLERIKHPYNGFVNPSVFMKEGGCQVSEEIPIFSEWRVFVFNNEIQHIANYSGDFLTFPDANSIREMVKCYSDEAPKAYTLDVGVNNEGTFVIECHRFFSCGLYGFSDHARIPKMFSQEWFEMINMR